jgi:hypothetical protein
LPLPFWPNAYEKMRSAQDELTPEQILMAGWSVWAEEKAFPGAPAPESRLPATRVCFRGLDDPFAWTPELTIDWLPEPGRPLAWRLYRFVSQWEDALGEQS